MTSSSQNFLFSIRFVRSRLWWDAQTSQVGKWKPVVNLGGKEKAMRSAEQKPSYLDYFLALRLAAGRSSVKSVKFYHTTRRYIQILPFKVTAVNTSNLPTKKFHALRLCSVYSSIWCSLTRKHVPRTKQENNLRERNNWTTDENMEGSMKLLISELRNTKKDTIPQNIATWIMAAGELRL